MDQFSGGRSVSDRGVDVVTEGGYIASGAQIEVVADEGYRRVVRTISDAEPSASDGESGAECRRSEVIREQF